MVIVMLSIATVLISGCIKPNTFNPYNPPDRGELDRLQKIINDRPDLETVKQQLIDLDGTIRATTAKYAPQTALDPSKPKSDRGCTDPFVHNIGDTYATNYSYGRPAPTPEQWQQIVAALDPVFREAGFVSEVESVVAHGGPSPPPGYQNDVQLRDDGARIELVGGSGNSPMYYSFSTGCHLPGAWRTAQPPPDRRPGNDPGVHYPYLYGPPGGRTAPA